MISNLPLGYCVPCMVHGPAFEMAQYLVYGTSMCPACAKAFYSASLPAQVVAVLSKVPRQPGGKPQ